MNKRRSIAEINVVPYVDVMLVLLVIFMITAPIINQGVEVNLPTASAKPLPQDTPMPIVVSVSKDAELFLSIAPEPKSPINAEKLQAEVAAALMRDSKRQVIVRADKNVTYNTVLQAMVLLQSAGVPNVGLETTNVER